MTIWPAFALILTPVLVYHIVLMNLKRYTFLLPILLSGDFLFMPISVFRITVYSLSFLSTIF